MHSGLLHNSRLYFDVSQMLIDSKRLVPIIARRDLIIEMNVCTRRFRSEGSRIESERIGRKNVVHNYGRGGNGCSLFWADGQIDVEMAKSTRRKELVVIDCGTISLTIVLVT